MPEYEYGRLDGDASADTLGAVLSQCFYASEEFWEAYRKRMGDENLRVLTRAGRIVGGLGVLRLIEGEDRAVAAADRIFAGPEPWMCDHF